MSIFFTQPCILQKYCYQLGRECQWTKFANMSKVRIGAASIEMKDKNGVRIKVVLEGCVR